MSPAEFLTAVRKAVHPLELQYAREAILALNAMYGLAVAVHVAPELREEYLQRLTLHVSTLPPEFRRKVENPDKKREADSPLKTHFTIHHLNLAYWMGRSLGEGTRTLEDWQTAVMRACGSAVPLGDMTEAQCRDVLVGSGLFTPASLPYNTEHMTQRTN